MPKNAQFIINAELNTVSIFFYFKYFTIVYLIAKLFKGSQTNFNEFL